jgi:hypothetical protein
MDDKLQVQWNLGTAETSSRARKQLFFQKPWHSDHCVSEIMFLWYKSSRSQWPRGLSRRCWSLGCWDRGFKSRSEHGCLLCLYVLLSCVGIGLCDGLITRPEESYRPSNSMRLKNLKEGGQSPFWALESFGWMDTRLSLMELWVCRVVSRENKRSVENNVKCSKTEICVKRKPLWLDA